MNAIRALLGLYADENNYATLDVFTQRFKGRILQCTLDTETSVSLAAIELATRLAGYNANSLRYLSPSPALILIPSTPHTLGLTGWVHWTTTTRASSTLSCPTSTCGFGSPQPSTSTTPCSRKWRSTPKVHTSLLLCSLLRAVTNRTSLGLNYLGLPQARRTRSASS